MRCRLLEQHGQIGQDVVVGAASDKHLDIFSGCQSRRVPDEGGVFGGEIVEERARRHVGDAADVFDGDVVDSALAGQGQHGVLNGPPGGEALALAQSGQSGQSGQFSIDRHAAIISQHEKC